MILLLWLSFLNPAHAAEDPCAANRPGLFEAERPTGEDAPAQIDKACASWSIAAHGGIEYLSDGSIDSAFCVVDEKHQGPVARWHSTGKLASVGNLGPDGLCGKWSRYFENGELRDEGRWENGEPAGPWKSRPTPGAELTERDFKGKPKLGSEWSLLAGFNFQAIKDDNWHGPGTKTNTPYGPTLSARWGHGLFSLLHIELGVNVMTGFLMRPPPISSGSGLSESAQLDGLTISPFPSVGLFFKLGQSGFRLGLWGGITVPISLNFRGPSNGGVKGDPSGFLSTQDRTPLTGAKFGKNVILELDVTPTLRVIVDYFMIMAQVGIEF